MSRFLRLSLELNVSTMKPWEREAYERRVRAWAREQHLSQLMAPARVRPTQL